MEVLRCSIPHGFVVLSYRHRTLHAEKTGLVGRLSNIAWAYRFSSRWYCLSSVVARQADQGPPEDS